jgi:prolyl-tRNA synthetase
VLPIIRSDDQQAAVLAYGENLAARLREKTYHGRPLEVVIDKRDINAGEKGWSWVKKGIPLRVEVGPRDMAQQAVFVGRRDDPDNRKTSRPLDAFVDEAPALLDAMQEGLLARARAFRDDHTRDVDDWETLTAFFTPRNREKPEIHGGFARAHWCDGPDCETQINDALSVTIRCIPLDRGRDGGQGGACVVCGRPSAGRVLLAKGY